MNLNNQNITQISRELMTLRDYVRWGYSQLNAANIYYGHGTDNAWDEIVYLVSATLNLPPDIDPDLMNAALTIVERRQVCNLILRRIKERIPVAYLVHQAWFAGLPFYVDQRVIIPRSPIAELIEQKFAPWLQEDQHVQRILDLCTGSGCIAIACGLAFPGCQVDAVDISSDALEVAAINVKKYGLEGQVHLFQSNLLVNINPTIRYDLIISNPPYVGVSEYQSLPEEYQHEPKLALVTGESGLQIVRDILSKATNYLTSDGILIVEVGNTQEILSARYPEVPFLWLEFERGGHGVFLLTANELKKYHAVFNR
jgi:ribosomal protein L3 glutamine methyltransferase